MKKDLKLSIPFKEWTTVEKYNNSGCPKCHNYAFRDHISWQGLQKGVCTKCGHWITLFDSEEDHKNYVKTGHCWSKTKRIKEKCKSISRPLEYCMDWIQDEFYHAMLDDKYNSNSRFHRFTYTELPDEIYSRLKSYLDLRDHYLSLLEEENNK